MTNQERPIDSVIELARSYWDMNKNEAALEQAAEALRIDPEHYDALYISGWNCYELARYSEALEFGKLLIKQQPDDLYVHRLLGLIYRVLTMFEESVEALTRSLELNPNEALSYHHLAVTICEQARYQYGGSTYRKTLFGVKWKRNMKEQLDEAIELLQTSIRLEPDSGWSYMYLSYVLRLLGRAEQSEKLIGTALQLDPQNDQFLAEYAVVLKDLGRIEEAVEPADAAINIDPSNEFCINVQETVRQDQARYITYLRSRFAETVAFAKLNDNDPDILLRGIRIALLGKKLSPKLLLKEYLKQCPDDLEMSLHYGSTLYKEKLYRQASAHFKQCSERYPDHPQVEAWMQQLSKLKPGVVHYRHWIANPLRQVVSYIIFVIGATLKLMATGIFNVIIFIAGYFQRASKKRAERKKSLTM